MRNSHDAALLAWQDKKAQADAEREAAAKAVEEADKKNRESEKQAFKDIGNFVIDLTTPVGDIRAIYEWLQGDKNARTTLAAVLGVFGVKGGAKKADELADLVEAQARDARAWVKKGGIEPLPKAKEEYAARGVLPIDEATQQPSFDALRPEAIGQRNTTGFRSRNEQPVTDELAFKGATKDRTMTAHTQGQANPQATAGLEPPGAPKMGDVYEDTGKYAGARLEHWDKGFDPEKFKAHVSAKLYARSKEAAKGKHGGRPEFWVYDEKARQILVITRDKDDVLTVKKGKASWYEKDPETGLPMKDPNGNVIVNDNIDMVVPSDAKGEVDRMIYELMLERLEIK